MEFSRHYVTVEHAAHKVSCRALVSRCARPPRLRPRTESAFSYIDRRLWGNYRLLGTAKAGRLSMTATFSTGSGGSGGSVGDYNSLGELRRQIYSHFTFNEAVDARGVM